MALQERQETYWQRRNFDLLAHLAEKEMRLLDPSDRALVKQVLSGHLFADNATEFPAAFEVIRKRVMQQTSELIHNDASSPQTTAVRRWLRDMRRIKSAYPTWSLSAQGITPYIPYDSAKHVNDAYKFYKEVLDILQLKIKRLNDGAQAKSRPFPQTPDFFSSDDDSLSMPIGSLFEPLDVFRFEYSILLLRKGHRQANLALLLAKLLHSRWLRGVPKIPVEVLERDLASRLPEVVSLSLEALAGYSGGAFNDVNSEELLPNTQRNMELVGTSGELVYLFNASQHPYWSAAIKEELTSYLIASANRVSEGLRSRYSQRLRALRKTADASTIAPTFDFAGYDQPLSQEVIKGTTETDFSTIGSSWAFKVVLIALLLRWICQNLFVVRPRYLSGSIVAFGLSLVVIECATIKPYFSNEPMSAVLPVGIVLLLFHNKSAYGFEWHASGWSGVVYNLFLTAGLFATAWMIGFRKLQTDANANLFLTGLIALLGFEAVHQMVGLRLSKLTAGVLASVAVILIFMVEINLPFFTPACMYTLAGLQLCAVLALSIKLLRRRIGMRPLGFVRGTHD